MYQIKFNDCYVNTEIVLINLKKTQTLYFSVFAILLYTAFKSPDDGSLLYETLLPLSETNAFIKCSTNAVSPFPHGGMVSFAAEVVPWESE